MNVEEVGQSLHDILFLGMGNDEEIRVQKELCLVYFRDVSHIYDLATVYLQESFLGKLGKDMAKRVVLCELAFKRVKYDIVANAFGAEWN